MAKPHLKLVSPSTVNRTVPPKRLPNRELRTREYLTEAEVEKLIFAAKHNRYGHRDATMILSRLPAWAPRQRADGLALGSDRLRDRDHARPPRQAGDARHAPDTR